MVFDEDRSRVMIPNVNIGDCDYTIAFWIRLSQYGQSVEIFGSARSWNSPLLTIDVSSAKICREDSTRISMTCMRTPNVALMNSWTHIAVTCEQDDDVKIFINGEPSSVLIFSSPVPDSSSLTYGDKTMVPKEKFVVVYISSPLIMDLHIFGFALPRDDIYDLSRGSNLNTLCVKITLPKK